VPVAIPAWTAARACVAVPVETPAVAVARGETQVSILNEAAQVCLQAGVVASALLPAVIQDVTPQAGSPALTAARVLPPGAIASVGPRAWVALAASLVAIASVGWPAVPGLAFH
jgi:hypothetical protein